MFGSWIRSTRAKELAPFKYKSLPLGSIKPSGWLRQQIRRSGDGLGGHLYDFYRFVRRSSWLGGTAEYSDLAESATYWFNYIVPMAWALDDERLKAQAREFLDYVLEHQAEDGWLGPETTRQTRCLWARSYLCLGLMQYAEADSSQAERIVDAMHRYVVLVHTMLKNNFTGLIPDTEQGDTFDPYLFGVSRAHELPVSLMWLYENHARDNGPVIWETMELMFEGSRVGGQDWTKFFTRGVFPERGTPDIHNSGFTHGVNLAEGLRYPTLLYRLTREPGLIRKAYEAVDLTCRYQTSLSGTIVGDEHLGGLSPQRGSELCMTVELMFSYAYLYRFHGENSFADSAELAAFNALPAGVTSDWWAHQYVTQTNQPWACQLNGNPWDNVSDRGNIYGLEPNYPCCTVNHPQGYPKFIASAYATFGDCGLVHLLLSPSVVNTALNGKEVNIECITNYPFSERLRYIIDSETELDFFVRVPGWTLKGQATIVVNGNGASPMEPDCSGLYRILVRPGLTDISVHLPMGIRVVTRNESVAIYHGPLLYAADIEMESKSYPPLDFADRRPLPVGEAAPQCRDYEFVPKGEWRYAIDPRSLSVERVRPEEEDLPSDLFTPGGPPTRLWVDAYRIDWPERDGTADVPPTRPRLHHSKKIRMGLIPFGAAKLHIAQFPVAVV
ncbi:hypothetical protein B0I35DRAFT_376750 [Stachybotrys elegans]|uniref:Non-reducing end beta-L-arabinofuranosidase-like GH127 middle domain-containing protein n=1 Tax=Stachybotrys elegans TaxID=80388 RepID=A0A8K0SJU6_9HYPO|nr:hypothetical protein B0I35DRAFT_376750 [Stachybotrys elegans]